MQCWRWWVAILFERCLDTVQTRLLARLSEWNRTGAKEATLY